MQAPTARALGVFCLLAGCSQPGAPEEPTRPVLFEGGGDQAGNGGLVGVVVDEAIRPLPNVTVALERVGNRTSAQDGSFSFVDLPPGAYALTAGRAGFREHRSSVDVAAGQLAQVRLMLAAMPAAPAYNVTLPFNGFAQLTSAGEEGALVELLVKFATGESACNRCAFGFRGEPGLHSIVLDATMAPHSVPTGSNGFAFLLERNGTARSLGNHGNPMTAVVDVSDMGGGDFDLTLFPYSDPVPEPNKAFQVLVTLFYEQPPPEGFSALGDG